MFFTLRKKDNNTEDDCLIIDGESDNSYFDIFGNSSLTYFIYEKLNFHCKRTCLVDGISHESETFEQVCYKAMSLVSSLGSLGLLPSETVGIICENRLEYCTVLLASMFTGTVFAPINPTYTPDEIIHVFSISKPRLIFCSALASKNLGLALPYLTGVCHVILFDDGPIMPIGCTIHYEYLLQSKPASAIYLPGDNEVAVILTSSGTTGLPKGVMLSYANLKYFLKLCVSSTFLNLQQDDAVLGLLPLFHGYGYGLLLSCLMIGAKLVLLPKFEENLFLSSIEKYKITNLYLVPPLMVFLGKHPLVMMYNLSSVRDIVCGAAPLGREVTAQVQARLPHADIRQGWGMTEASIASTITPPHSDNPESVGKLVGGLQAKVVDVETGKSLKRLQHGEILLRGACVMVGYCNDPEATGETVDENGWLHTGDIGFVDEQGFFYIVDRKKELIKYKGYQVAPAELESILLGMPGVRDAAVVGQPDVTVGELPIAYVTLQPNTTLTDTDILEHVNSKVSPHKRLRGVRFINSIPRNPSGKILRRFLKTPTSKL